jgi:hemerythrin-like domain-containing protein
MRPAILVDPPAAGFDDPFGMLDTCHDRIRRSLALLERLVAHLRTQGIDEPAQSAARDVLRYFTLAAPAHHEDEERHVVPTLRASGDPAATGAAERMLADHGALRAAWAILEPLLAQLAAGTAPDAPALQRAARRFIDLHADHLRLEDEVAFPQAARQLRDVRARGAMGTEMAQRRGVAAPPR